MNQNTLLLFTRNGLGDAPEGLQTTLTVKFLALLRQTGKLPGRIAFYTEGVKLVCSGSLVLEHLRALEEAGVELIVCQTCLEYFGLLNQVAVGKVMGMPDIIAAMQSADKVISL
ncbi:MAG: DsrE family protein [Anaerolineaceae bacterium]